jgi:hypothetical protein
MSGLPCCDQETMDGLAPALTPAVVLVRVFQCVAGTTDRVAILARACQHLWLVDIHGAYRSSHMLGLPPSLTPRPHSMLAVRETSSRSSPRPEGQGVLSRQLPTRPLPVSPVPLGYCGRNRRSVMEVSSSC